MEPEATKRWCRQVVLVRGYHRDSYPPVLAYEAGLRHRFAVVLHSAHEGSPDALFDAEFFVEIATDMQRAIDHDSVAIRFNNSGSDCDSLSRLRLNYPAYDELDREAPATIRYFQGGRLICLVATEFWVYGGGPWPYHDSYTYSYYTATDRHREFISICESVCARQNAAIREVLEAAPRKEPFIPWYRMPMKWLGLKAWKATEPARDDRFDITH